MTSQIVSTTIDETYPLAGQDNDSQGFRDNFSIIKDGLAAAASEITDLQNNVILKGPIGEMGIADIENNFNGTLIDNAITNRLSELVFLNETPPSASVTIDYNSGSYQTISIAGNCTLRIENWPTFDNALSKITISIDTVALSDATVSFTSLGSETIKKNWAGNFVISPGTSTKIVEVWTYDKGETVFLYYKDEFEVQ